MKRIAMKHDQKEGFDARDQMINFDVDQQIKAAWTK